jgi:hypothetical protein
MRRAWALRAAVVSLGIGVTLIPLPFLQMPPLGTWLSLGGGALVSVVWLAYEGVHYVRRRLNSN